MKRKRSISFIIKSGGLSVDSLRLKRDNARRGVVVQERRRDPRKCGFD